MYVYVCILLSNKKRNLRKYSVAFLKHFQKKLLFFGGPCMYVMRIRYKGTPSDYVSRFIDSRVAIKALLIIQEGVIFLEKISLELFRTQISHETDVIF